MSYFESLCDNDEQLMENTSEGDWATSSSHKQEKCTTKNSLLDHFTVTKNNHKSHTADHNLHSQISNPHSSDDSHDPVMSQDEIDHLFSEDDFDSWFDDIT